MARKAGSKEREREKNEAQINRTILKSKQVRTKTSVSCADCFDEPPLICNHYKMLKKRSKTRIQAVHQTVSDELLESSRQSLVDVLHM